MKTIKIGVIGTGLIWEKVHFPVISGLPETYTIQALCVRSEKNQGKWQKQLPTTKIYDNYQALLADETIDAVLVATPIEMNHVVVMDALKASKDVFAEKPLALTSEQGAEIIALEKEFGKKVWMLEQFLYASYYGYLKSMIAEQVLGQPIMFEKVTHGFLDGEENDAGGFGKTLWRLEPKFPLGLIFDGGAHDVALITSLFGMPKSLYSIAAKLRDDMGEFDHIVTSFNYGKNLSGVYSHSAFLSDKQNHFTIHFTNGIVRVNGNDLEIQNTSGVVEEKEFDNTSRHVRMWKKLALDCHIRGDGLFPVQLAVENLKLYEAIQASIRLNQSIEVD